MRCEEIMEKAVEFVSPDDTIQEAAALMRDEGIGFLPVCEKDQQVVGTLTDRDIAVRAVAEGRELDEEVSEIMTEEVIGCSPSDDISRAQEIMSKQRVSRVMCLDDDGKLLGVISLADLARSERGQAAKAVQEIKQEGQGPHAQ